MNPSYRYIFLLFYIVCEVFLRKKNSAKNVKIEKKIDQGSTFTIGIAFFVAALIAPLLNNFNFGFFALPIFIIIGNACMLVGILLRGWSLYTLKNLYTKTLQIGNNQKLITTGPYTLIRHPGYTGSILFWSGYQLAAQNICAVVIVFIMMKVVYEYRVEKEEEMLTHYFRSAYKDYKKYTKKFIPFLY